MSKIDPSFVPVFKGAPIPLQKKYNALKWETRPDLWFPHAVHKNVKKLFAKKNKDDQEKEIMVRFNGRDWAAKKYGSATTKLVLSDRARKVYEERKPFEIYELSGGSKPSYITKNTKETRQYDSAEALIAAIEAM